MAEEPETEAGFSDDVDDDASGSEPAAPADADPEPAEERDGEDGEDASAGDSADGDESTESPQSEDEDATSQGSADGNEPESDSDEPESGGDGPEPAAPAVPEEDVDSEADDEGAGETAEGEAGASADIEAVEREEGPPDAPGDGPEPAGPAEPPEEGPEPTEATELDDLAPEGPPDDEEMPLADHIEEMVLRLAIVGGVMAVVTAVVFPFAEVPIQIIWHSVLPANGAAGQPGITDPRVYGPLELKLTELKFAGLAGFVVALPVFVYETYRFMRPGLYPHERRYYLAAVPTSLVLAFVGVSFAYFLVLPAIFTYFMTYSQVQTAPGEQFLIGFALRQTFDLILILMGYMALVFQIPLFVMLAIMMNLTSRVWLEDRRLYFWGAFLGLSFIFSPDPTGMAPIIVALTMVGLFEGTLALLRWTGN